MNNLAKLPAQVEAVFDRLEVTTSRRNFLKASGLLMVSLHVPGVAAAAVATTTAG